MVRQESASLPAILVATIAVLFVGYLTKQACFALGIGESFYCFSDYGGLYLERDLAGGRFPYFPPALEYPSGLGLIIWFTSAVTSSALEFVRLTMAIAAVAGIVIGWLVWKQVGRRALMFAAAPTLALYAFLNWDLIALVFAVAGIVAFSRRRDSLAGAMIGIGAAIKAFPILLLLPMLADRWRYGERRAAATLLTCAVATVFALNAPVMWASFDGWAHFLRFNSARPADWGTIWSAGCHAFGSGLCANIPLVNAISLIAFVAGSILTCVLVLRTAPHLPRWQLGFAILVMFFLTNKVYSPQYSLWILPWFALVLPSIPLFLAYEAIDIGIYVTTFGWQQRLTGSGGLPLWSLHVFLALRAVLLVTMLVVFARRSAAATRHE